MSEDEALTWKKSPLSASSDCVEWAVDMAASCVFVRDSKNPDGPRLRFTDSEWRAFVEAAKNGDADL